VKTTDPTGRHLALFTAANNDNQIDAAEATIEACGAKASMIIGNEASCGFAMSATASCPINFRSSKKI
jgi:hypothetical protein